MKHSTEIHINFKGGIVSPGELLDILNLAGSHGVEDVRFGLRQQMMMQVPAGKFEAFAKACHVKSISYETGKNKTPNIVSSYAAANIFTQDSWLREGVYKDIFSQFTYRPRLKINICDSGQNLVPFFTGHLNWLSSPKSHFWHLYIRLPRTSQTFCWPELIYTNDIAAASEKIEELLLQLGALVAGKDVPDISSIVAQVQHAVKYVSAPADGAMQYKKFQFPYYEGLNSNGQNCWLGIYRRDELFPIGFLIDICNICLETKIGQLYTTPWKTIIIKGIENAHRILWEHVLGKHRINVRHAANELNWQVEDGTEDGLIVKRHIIRHFDKEDVRTYGLIFAVETSAASSMFGSVIIRLRQNKGTGNLKSQERFDILYTKDFNPNSKDFEVYRDNVKKDFIGTYLVSLCKYYYEEAANKNPIVSIAGIAKASSPLTEQVSLVHQCTKCMTVYDDVAGDSEAGALPGTPFNALPVDYCCPLCAAPKEEFLEINREVLYNAEPIA